MKLIIDINEIAYKNATDYSEESHTAMMMAIDALSNDDAINHIIAEVKKMDTLITKSEVLEVIDKCLKGDEEC